jgi:Per1-like family
MDFVGFAVVDHNLSKFKRQFPPKFPRSAYQVQHVFNLNLFKMLSMGPKAPGILVAVALLSTVLASSGDRSQMFQSCVDLCSTERCDIQQPVVLPLALQLTRWSCADDCRYSCMHEITSRDAERGTPAQQYYGKWPFWRFAGMQEPASVAFSLLNLWSHVRGARNVQKKIPSNHPMKTYYLVWSFVSVNAWFWSSIFHTRGKFHMNLPSKQSDIYTQIFLPPKSWTTSRPHWPYYTHYTTL